MSKPQLTQKEIYKTTLQAMLTLAQTSIDLLNKISGEVKIVLESKTALDASLNQQYKKNYDLLKTQLLTAMNTDVAHINVDSAKRATQVLHDIHHGITETNFEISRTLYQTALLGQSLPNDISKEFAKSIRKQENNILTSLHSLNNEMQKLLRQEILINGQTKTIDPSKLEKISKHLDKSIQKLNSQNQQYKQKLNKKESPAKLTNETAAPRQMRK